MKRLHANMFISFAMMIITIAPLGSALIPITASAQTTIGQSFQQLIDDINDGGAKITNDANIEKDLKTWIPELTEIGNGLDSNQQSAFVNNVYKESDRGGYIYPLIKQYKSANKSERLTIIKNIISDLNTDNTCTVLGGKFLQFNNVDKPYQLDDSKKFPVDIQINFADNCVTNQPLIISIISGRGNAPDSYVTNTKSSPQSYDFPFTVPESKSVTLNFNGGEDGCWVLDDPDCNYYFEIYNPGKNINTQIYTSNGGSVVTGGILFANCDTHYYQLFAGCFTNWEFLGQKENITPADLTNPWYYKLKDKNGNTIKDTYISAGFNQADCEAAASKDGGEAGSCTQNPPQGQIAKGQVGTGGGDPLPDCGIGVVSGSSLSGCIVQILYYLIYTPSSYLLMGAGIFFDWLFDYSISSTAYSSATFVTNAWGLVRDISTIAFIFVLLWVSISTILGMGKTDWKKTVSQVVIWGILINFSLFFAKIPIDMGNVISRLFRNSNVMSVKDEKGEQRSMSVALIEKSNPQTMIYNATKVGEDSSYASRSSYSSGDGISNGAWIILIMIASIVNIVALKIFLSMGLAFVGRVVDLWLLMIMAPLAFMSKILPNSKGLGDYSFGKWYSNLLNQSFMAPIFMFFMYLILLFVQLSWDNIKNIATGNLGGINWILSIVVPFIFLIIMLGLAKKKAMEFAGEASREIVKFTDKAIGAVGGIAAGASIGLVAGGAAKIGSNLIGGAASKTLEGEKGDKLREKEAAGGISGWMARQKLKALEKTSTASFDMRTGAVGGMLNRIPGMDSKMAGNTSKFLGLGVQEKGYVGRVADKEKELKDRMKATETKLSDDQVKEMRGKEIKDYDKKFADKKPEYDQKVTAKEASEKARLNRELTAEEKSKLEKDIRKDMKLGEKPAEVTTAAGLNRERQLAWADNLENKRTYIEKAADVVKKLNPKGPDVILGAVAGGAVGSVAMTAVAGKMSSNQAKDNVLRSVKDDIKKQDKIRDELEETNKQLERATKLNETKLATAEKALEKINDRIKSEEPNVNTKINEVENSQEYKDVQAEILKLQNEKAQAISDKTDVSKSEDEKKKAEKKEIELGKKILDRESELKEQISAGIDSYMVDAIEETRKAFEEFTNTGMTSNPEFLLFDKQKFEKRLNDTEETNKKRRSLDTQASSFSRTIYSNKERINANKDKLKNLGKSDEKK